MKCSDVERAVTVFSGSELLLFVQLKTTVHCSWATSSSRLLATQLRHQDSASNNHQTDIMSAKSNYAAAADDDVVDISNLSGSDDDDKVQLTAREAICNEIKTLLKQWLPVHCQPDDVEIIDTMPSTNHGKFQSYRHVVSVLMTQ